MSKKFHYRSFDLSDPYDAEEYEELMETIINDPVKYKIHAESGFHTKDGRHMMHISYLKFEDDGDGY